LGYFRENLEEGGPGLTTQSLFKSESTPFADPTQLQMALRRFFVAPHVPRDCELYRSLGDLLAVGFVD
jgi:hypothetical protein